MSLNRTLAVALAVASTVPGLSAQQPATSRLSGLTRDLACAPSSPMVKPTPALVVVGGREPRKTLFGTGDALVIRGGASQGVKAGDEFFVRRIVDDRYNEQRTGRVSGQHFDGGHRADRRGPERFLGRGDHLRLRRRHRRRLPRALRAAGRAREPGRHDSGLCVIRRGSFWAPNAVRLAGPASSWCSTAAAITACSRASSSRSSAAPYLTAPSPRSARRRSTPFSRDRRLSASTGRWTRCTSAISSPFTAEATARPA